MADTPVGPTRHVSALREVTLTEARRSWQRLINEVVDTDTPVTLTRYGKPVAVLTPYGWLDPQRGTGPETCIGSSGL